MNSEVVLGTDISHYQGSVNWPVLVHANIKFVFIKATQNIEPDPMFSSHWSYLNENSFGLLKSPYHFFDTSADAEAQANAFCFTVGALKTNDLPPVCDIEIDQTHGTLDSVTRISNLQTFLNIVEQKLGKKPIIYTNMSFFSDYFNNSTVFSNYKLWLARYPSTAKVLPTDPIPQFYGSMECGWTGLPAFWQFSENGYINGGNNATCQFDLSVFFGSINDLQALC